MKSEKIYINCYYIDWYCDLKISDHIFTAIKLKTHTKDRREMRQTKQ